MASNGILEQKSAAERAEDDKKTLELDKAELRSHIEKLEKDKKVLESEITELKNHVNQKESEFQQFAYRLQEITNSVSGSFKAVPKERIDIGVRETFPSNNQPGYILPITAREERAARFRNEEANGEPKIFFKKHPILTTIIALCLFGLFILLLLGLKYVPPMFFNNNSLINDGNTSSPLTTKSVNPPLTIKNTPTQLNPPPNGFLNKEDLNRFNKGLQPGITAGEVANKAINTNKNYIKIAYDSQRDAYTKKLIEENPNCFDGTTKESKLICEELLQVPIYQQR